MKREVFTLFKPDLGYVPGMGKREALVEAYLGALEAKALLILTIGAGHPAKISFSPDPSFETFDALWFAKPHHAELVLMRCMDDLATVGAVRPEGWIDMPAREVRDAVVNAAAQLGARWQTTDQIKSSASNEVEKIIAQVDRQRREGGLAQVNAEYKTYRQRQVAAGQKAAPYSAHLMTFTRSLVVLAAANVNA